MRWHKTSLIACLLLVCVSSFAAKVTPEYRVEVVAQDLNHPWSLAFLSDGGILVTEKGGQLFLIKEGQKQLVSGLPDDIWVKGQGGLQEVVLHPDFADNSWVYLSYASGQAKKNALKVVRAKLSGSGLTEMETVFTVNPFKDTPVHYGAKMLFLPDNTLLLTTGDGFDYREDAQRINNQLGKIIRINDDGSIPSDNPFASDPQNPLSHAVYSLGHRNPQGLAYHKGLNKIFAHEHGPAGGDEINIIEPGNNYGWPVITNGRDYSGASISPFKSYQGMEQPFWDWTPSIAPSGMAVYQGDIFPDMQGDLLVGTLKDRDVKWMQMENSKVIKQISLFAELDARIRDVRVKDGEIYLLTDAEQGNLLKVTN